MSNGLKLEPFSMDELSKCDDTDLSQLPDTYDLRDYGYVSPVKNQGQCGSCYAFAAVGAMESQHMKKHHFKSFSEQAFVNCNSCDGGIISVVFNQAINDGISLEDDVPYTEKVCSIQQSNKSFQYLAFFCLQKEDCQEYESYKKLKRFCYRISLLGFSDDVIRALIYYYGAVSAGIDADGESFPYTKGKYNGDDCRNNPYGANHAVLIVGWTEDSWIIKNSWGTDWGDNGYVYLKRGTCSINYQFSVPLFD